MFNTKKKYDLNYLTVDELYDASPTYEKLQRIDPTLTKSNYLTHLIILAQHKSLTPELKEYHQNINPKEIEFDS